MDPPTGKEKNHKLPLKSISPPKKKKGARKKAEALAYSPPAHSAAKFLGCTLPSVSASLFPSAQLRGCGGGKTLTGPGPEKIPASALGGGGDIIKYDYPPTLTVGPLGERERKVAGK